MSFPLETVDTLSVEQALHDYLTGRDGVVLVDPLRSEAQKRLRQIVGVCVFAGRRPRSATGRTAVTIQRQSTQRDYLLREQFDIVLTTLGVDVWTKDLETKGQRTVSEAWVYIVRLVSNFIGQWSGMKITGCQVDDSSDLPIRPVDASDGWTMRHGGILRITHVEQIPWAYLGGRC